MNKYLIYSILFLFSFQSCSKKENRLKSHLRYLEGNKTEQKRFFYEDNGLLFSTVTSFSDKDYSLYEFYIYTDNNLDSIYTILDKEIITSHHLKKDLQGRVTTDIFYARISEALEKGMKTEISYIENTRYPESITKTSYIENYRITQNYLWENGNCVKVTTIIGDKNYVFDIEYDNNINPLSTINNLFETRYEYLSKNNPLRNKENPDGLFYEYSQDGYPEKVFTKKDDKNSLIDVYQMEEFEIKSSPKLNISGNSQSKYKSTTSIKEPELICDSQYMLVSKDTYDYYMKKLGYSGLVSNESIQKKLENKNVVCFLSLSDYGEEENVLFEPISYKMNDEQFSELINTIKEREENSKNEKVNIYLLNSGKGIYGNKFPYYIVKTKISINPSGTKRYSFTYFIIIEDKPYLLIINTFDEENNIDKAVLSINKIKSK